MIAFPHMTRLASGTIADNDRLRTVLAKHPRTGDYLSSPVFNGGKLEFYYPILERIWGKDPVCRATRLDLIVFPALDPRRSTAAAVAVPSGEAIERLRSSLLHDPPLPDWLPFFRSGERARIEREVAESFLRFAPPAYELRFGPASSDPIGVLEGLLGP